MKKLLEINRSTGIETRATIRSYDDAFWNRSTPPSIADLDGFFRKAGVDLTVQACKKALGEWGGAVRDITHAVGVTCTNAGNPGFDLLVAQKLGLPDDIDRVLLHGVGCAGGLAAMRAAANMAGAATLRGRPARVLVFACELCSIHVRCDLDAVAANPGETKIAPALFSDGAAAFVLCNGLASEAKGKGIYSLVDWGNAVLPGTQQHMAFLTDPIGALA
jgi:type III polyketide synthase